MGRSYIVQSDMQRLKEKHPELNVRLRKCSRVGLVGKKGRRFKQAAMKGVRRPCGALLSRQASRLANGESIALAGLPLGCAARRRASRPYYAMISRPPPLVWQSIAQLCSDHACFVSAQAALDREKEKVRNEANGVAEAKAAAAAATTSGGGGGSSASGDLEVRTRLSRLLEPSLLDRIWLAR